MRPPRPFAVVSRFSVLAHSPLRRALGLRAIREVFDAMAPNAPGIVAVRLDGEFIDLHLRSVHPQTPPYAPLVEVTSHQTEWSVPSASGSVVGFRFPDRVAGVEVPAYHLHFVSGDRTHGGHVLDLTMAEGDLQVAGADDLHVEVPEHLGLGTPGAADRAALRQAEPG